MKRSLRFSRPVIALAVGLAALAVAGGVWAAAGFTLDRGRPVSGGASSGGGYTLIGAAGQPEAGRLSGGGYVINGGVLHEEPTRTATATQVNTPQPGATLTFTPLPPSATPVPATATASNTPPPGASPTPTPTNTPILPDLTIGIAPIVGASEASASTITGRDGQTLELPAGIELPAAATNLNVTITNNGLVDTSSDFWVDLYVDPGRTPRVNLTWDANCVDICMGVSWHVTQALHPGESLTLSTASGYDPDNTLWPGFVPVLAHSVAVMVDSFTDQGTWYGMVLERDEANNVAQIALGAPTATPITPAPGGPGMLYLPAIMRGQ